MRRARESRSVASPPRHRRVLSLPRPSPWRQGGALSGARGPGRVGSLARRGQQQEMRADGALADGPGRATRGSGSS